MIDYKKKNFKYKQKYLDLKGGEKITIEELINIQGES